MGDGLGGGSGLTQVGSRQLMAAIADGRFPSIHPVVDFFNWLSVETSLPISVLDGKLIQGNWKFRLGQPGEQYVFNPSGQELKVEGLLVLIDEVGPTGSPVKDAQRTKVSDATEEFFVVIWGTQQLPENLERVRAEIEAWVSEQDMSWVS